MRRTNGANAVEDGDADGCSGAVQEGLRPAA